MPNFDVHLCLIFISSGAVNFNSRLYFFFFNKAADLFALILLQSNLIVVAWLCLGYSDGILAFLLFSPQYLLQNKFSDSHPCWD